MSGVMKLLISCALGAALLACGSTPRTPPAAVDRVPVRSNTPAPSNEPAATATSFAALVNGALSTREARVDASSLGGEVEVYLVKRFGGPGAQDPDRAQQLDLSLVLVGGGSSIRVELSALEEVLDPKRPFGELVAAPPFDHGGFDPEVDVPDAAPEWTNQSPALLSDSTHDLFGVTRTFVVTHEQDSLIVSSAETHWDESLSTAWERSTRVDLRDGASVTAPATELADAVAGSAESP